MLDDLASVHVVARYVTATASLAMVAAVLGMVTLWQRRRAVRLKLASQAALRAAHDSLESTVVARTAELRATQNDLVHAGKLAALGPMSAGMVHELNRPLTALRTLSESAGVLLDQQRPDEARTSSRCKALSGWFGGLFRTPTSSLVRSPTRHVVRAPCFRSGAPAGDRPRPSAA